MGSHVADNIVWNCLSGPHARFSRGDARAKRYAAGFPPLAGFPDPATADLDALRPLCGAGERICLLGWQGPVHGAWRLEVEAVVVQCLWDAPIPGEDGDEGLVRLGNEHAPQMVALAELTRPGPFGERNVEMGEYYGAFEGARLVAMAGERMAAGALREVSAVCTHPELRGRGLAGRLMRRVVRAQLARGQQPFLHAMKENALALALYKRMGFRARAELILRVLAPV